MTVERKIWGNDKSHCAIISKHASGAFQVHFERHTRHPVTEEEYWEPYWSRSAGFYQTLEQAESYALERLAESLK